MENTDSNRKAIKAGIGYTISNFLVKGLSFLTVPLFTGIMTIPDFGDYNTLLSYESIFSVIIGFTIHTSLKNAKLRYKDRFERYMSAIVILILLSTVGFLALANILKLVQVGFKNMDLVSVNALLLYSSASAFMMCYNSYVAIYYEYNSYLKVTMANAIGNILLSVFFIKVVFTNNTYMGRLIGSTIPMILTAVFIVLRLYKNRDLSKDEVIDYWKWGLKYSLPIIPHGLSQIILSQFDRIMIRDMIGSSEAAIYSFAYTIFLVVSVVTSSLTGVWDQWFYEQMSAGKTKEIRTAARHFTIIFFCFCFCYMLVSPELIRILGYKHKEYGESVYSVMPIIASGFFIFMYTFPAEIEYYNAKTKLIAMCTIIAAAANIALNYLLINKYGYISAAYTTLVTYIMYFILHYFISKRIYRKALYDEKIFVICGILIVVAIPLCTYLLKKMLVRWGMAVLVLVLSVIYAQKQFRLFDLIKGILNKWSNRNERNGTV